MATSYYNASEISAQEACYNLLRIRMSEASTGCIHIPTSKPELRMHMLRPSTELETMDPDSTDCSIQPGLIDHYTNRPDIFESLNLAQFAAYFEFSRSRPTDNRLPNPVPSAVNIDRNDVHEGDNDADKNEETAQVADAIEAAGQMPVDNRGGVPGRSYQLRAGNPRML